MRYIFIALFFNHFQFLIANTDDSLNYSRSSSYRDWNWGALVIDNKYITTAIVPSMGGNLLQYDFMTDTFLILNPRTFGNSYNPLLNESPFNQDWGFGGFEVWLTPEQWPPSPVLTFGEYSDTVLFHSSDSIKIQLESELETGYVPGLKFIKTYTVYKNSSLLRFKNSLVNLGTNQVKSGMMNVAEVYGTHALRQDYSNFKVYFPFTNNNTRITPASSAFLGEVAPGIYGVNYQPQRGKIYSVSPQGWIAYVDEINRQTYVLLYEIELNKEYPDQGANLEIYIENNEPFMALEALSPIIDLSPLTDTLDFTEYFGSCMQQDVVLKANLTGICSKRLKYDTITHVLSGKFGVFTKGSVKVNYFDTLGNYLAFGKEYKVVPDTPLLILDTLILPSETGIIRLIPSNGLEHLPDLDFYDIYKKENISIDYLSKNTIKYFKCYMYSQTLKIELMNYITNNYTINICDLSGNILMSDKTFIINAEYDLSTYTPGVYVVNINGNDHFETHKIIIVR